MPIDRLRVFENYILPLVSSLSLRSSVAGLRSSYELDCFVLRRRLLPPGTSLVQLDAAQLVAMTIDRYDNSLVWWGESSRRSSSGQDRNTPYFFAINYELRSP